MVSARQDVDAHRQDVVGKRRGDAAAGGGVLGVDDGKIDIMRRLQVGEPSRQDAASRLADDVADEQELHRAKPTARVSRITVTLISPGYWTSFSIRLAMSFDSHTASLSLT